MSLKYECDSCGALAKPNSDHEPVLPDKWTRIAIHYQKFDLCPTCSVLPMRFGNITYEHRPQALF